MKASIILVAAGLAAAKSAGMSMRSGAILRDNQLTFEPTGAETVSVTCSEIDHSISVGQPYKGLACVSNTLSVLAGRHDSSDVAKGFENGLDANHMFTTSEKGSAGSPKALNFYVDVNMSFKVGSTDLGSHTLRIGQGHISHGGNNWWVGGTNCFSAKSGINCMNKDGQKLFLGVKDNCDQLSVEIGWA